LERQLTPPPLSVINDNKSKYKQGSIKDNGIFKNSLYKNTALSSHEVKK